VRKINRSSTFKGRWTKALESVAFQRYATVMVVTLVVPLVRFWLNKAWRNVPDEVLWMVSEYADHTNKITDDVLAGCIIGLQLIRNLLLYQRRSSWAMKLQRRCLLFGQPSSLIHRMRWMAGSECPSAPMLVAV
jgi:hypothetical protein